MALIECRECKGKVSTSAQVCPHCGAPCTACRSRASERLKDGIAVFVALTVGLAATLGLVHIITGSEIGFPPHVVFKSSFGYSKTFINIDRITAMPCLAAKSKYPISVKLLQNEGYIESDEQFKRRVRREFEEEVANAEADQRTKDERLLRRQ